jgi:hypothetical protein
METTSAAHDIDASLQPIWYSEQTIVDDLPKESCIEEEDIAAVIREQQSKLEESNYASVIEENELPPQSSLMHKSSTFTIERDSSMLADTPLNDSEKENAPTPPVAPSDDSFRALEHLLGLGSSTTVRDSPKTNHDTLSLTVVTPTDLINTTTVSARMSFAPKNATDSLPSSQTLPTMATIESMDSTMLPSFLVENTVLDDEQPEPLTTMVSTNSNTDDDTNFSFELNDFPNNSKDVSLEPEPKKVEAPMPKIRAPTCADVAYRALIKPRAGARISQPIKAESPLARASKVVGCASPLDFLLFLQIKIELLHQRVVYYVRVAVAHRQRHARLLLRHQVE